MCRFLIEMNVALCVSSGCCLCVCGGALGLTTLGLRLGDSNIGTHVTITMFMFNVRMPLAVHVLGMCEGMCGHTFRTQSYSLACSGRCRPNQIQNCKNMYVCFAVCLHCF